MSAIGRASGWPAVALAAALIVAACGDASSPDTADGDVGATDSTTAPTSTERVDATTSTAPTTTSSTTTTSTTSTTSTTVAAATTTTTTATIPGPRTLAVLDRPAGNVAVFSDSMFADQTGDFQLFDLVRDGLLALDVGVIDVRNYAVPGQGIIEGLEVAEPGWHLLGSYLDARAGDPYLADLDLAVIGIGRVDANRLGADMEIDELAVLVADELDTVIERFESGGAQAVVIPAFGVNDEMFDALQCAAVGRCEPQRSEATFTALNAALIGAGLPVLFDRYSGTDLDDIPGTDAAWFTDFDPGGRWPDDGQHPNPDGEQLIADQVLHHLAVAFGAEPAGG